ncbi:anti-sigma factor [Ciceribacter thiooxidans]|uniref:Anti-sigma factor n=1 Tax=Ciceribacter thiooxidans TaxID=1969821 RepID=A0ABV7I336_9HYPH|nr:anti-sigma factor [Ciceribacter thiooxidans]
MNDKTPIPSDEELTAFIDGELDAAEHARITQAVRDNPQAAERLAFLERADLLPLRESFATLLDEAPRRDLEGMLAAIPAQDAAEPRNFARRGFITAIAASVAAGIVVDRAWMRFAEPSAVGESAEWRDAVAQYMALYTAETLGAAHPGREAAAAQLAIVNERLGLSLTPEAIALPGSEFKRAQILAYDDRPLAQILYVDPEGRPLALCIFASGTAEASIASERRYALDIAFWSNGRHAAMLIGHLPAGDIRRLAEGISRQIAA